MSFKINFNSIITRISTIFVITIALFTMNFIGYFKYQQDTVKQSIANKYKDIAKHTKDNRLRPQEIIEYTKDKNFQAVESPHEIINHMKNIISGPGYEAMQKDEIFYLHLHAPHFRLLLKDLSSYEKDYFGLLILGATLIVLVLSFLWIISALKPLKELKEEIRKFSQGNLTINCKSNKKDEIAELGNEFDNAANKISLLLESRQLFLRTVMHELKTPIAKGRIVSELIDDEKQKNRIIQIFEKLNLQIDDFAKIEQIVSQNYKINKQSLSINKIIEKSIDMMMLDNWEEKILLEDITNEKINADLELISLSFKNIIDNALKYSKDKKIVIKKEKDELLFISKGEKLPKALEEYFKPFHNETKSKNHGMGLGLYIVNSILQMHKMKFEYEYKDNQNIFKILCF